MNRKTKITIMVLSIFAVAMAMATIAAEPAVAKTFEDDGYKWEIKDNDWNLMKKSANEEYRHAEEQGRAIPRGFSYQKNVTVIKDGIEYDGIAFAVKNPTGIRCEVRGVAPEYLTVNDTVSAK